MKLQKALIPILALLFFVPLSGKASADISQVDCSVYTQNASLFDAAVNQQRFAQDMVTSIVTGPMMSTLTGVNFEKACACAKDAEGQADPSAVDSCKEIEPFIASGGLFITTKYAMDIAKNSKDIIDIRYYAQDILNHSPFTKTAYAADVSPLPMILDIWKEMRNFSYVFFVAVFIALGFMIMFRKRIDPQTVVTVQNSLPRVILSLVLITFSYPIVAIIFRLSGPLASFVWNTVGGTISGGQVANLTVRIVAFIAGLILIIAASLPTGIGIALVVLIGFIIFALIIGLVILALTFVTRLGKVAILTVLAPFIFLMGALPGNEKTILNWFKTIISLTLQIPALIFILLFGMSIGTSLSPLTGTGNVGIGLLSLIVNPLLGTVILFQAGKVPKMVDNALGVEPLMFGDDGKGKRGKK